MNVANLSINGDKLLADGEDTGLTLELSEENSWKDSFTELDLNKAGKAIEYTVEEEEIADYTVAISGDAEKGFVITNTHESEKTEIPVSKVWDDVDDQDGVRPDEVVILLLADGEKTGQSVVLSEENGWKDTFKDLDVKKDGTKIAYTVTEATVPHYAAEITGDAEKGFTVTNSHTPGKTTVTVEKVWDDKDDQDGLRPESVTVKLLADGEVAGCEGLLKCILLQEGDR